MEVPQHGILPVRSSDDSINRATANMVRCLEALDSQGEAGLQVEMDRMYLGTSADDGRPLIEGYEADPSLHVPLTSSLGTSEGTSPY